MVRLGEKVSCATRVLVVLVVEPGLVARELVPAPRLVDRLRRQVRHRAAVQAASRTARLLRGDHVVGAGRQKGWRPSASRPARAEEASACTIIGWTIRIAQRQVRCHADANRAFIFRTSNPPISIRSEEFRADPIGQRDRRVGAAPC